MIDYIRATKAGTYERNTDWLGLYRTINATTSLDIADTWQELIDSLNVADLTDAFTRFLGAITNADITGTVEP